MQSRIDVGMGQGVVAGAPYTVSSLGLGSCVAVTLYDTTRRIGGLAHIVLSDSRRLCTERPPYHCADTAIAALLDGLTNRGAVRHCLVAKLAGGARMFPANNGSATSIGDENITSVKRILKRDRIPVVGEDTGGHHGRNIEFCLDSGTLTVSAYGRKAIEL